jgi:hypothetical protein
VKPIRFTKHARARCAARGAAESEVVQSIREGNLEPAAHGKLMYRANFRYNGTWQGTHYAIKQIAAVVAEDRDSLVVVTVYTFYF